MFRKPAALLSTKNARTALLALAAAALLGNGSALALSDNAVRQAIIHESLATYPGNCPCPYNTDRAGRSCGRRSAYSRPGGYAPICYESQVTPQMITDYRRSH